MYQIFYHLCMKHCMCVHVYRQTYARVCMHVLTCVYVHILVCVRGVYVCIEQERSI